MDGGWDAAEWAGDGDYCSLVVEGGKVGGGGGGGEREEGEVRGQSEAKFPEMHSPIRVRLARGLVLAMRLSGHHDDVVDIILPTCSSRPDSRLCRSSISPTTTF